MSNPFVAEIRILSCNFAPVGWAFCNGQLLPISQNTALFSLVGTFYGGDGKSTFGLPNLQGMAALGMGQGPGLTDRLIGETGGETTVTILQTQMASHTHSGNCVSGPGNSNSPTGNVWAEDGETRGKKVYATAIDGTTQMNTGTLTVNGGNQPHNNLPPYLVLNFVIALVGVYPSRN
jgi:microcystin-dependent protein